MTEDGKSFSQEERGKPPGFFAEIISFAAQHKKWWLTPIVVVLVLAILLIFLGGSGVAPFIYSR